MASEEEFFKFMIKADCFSFIVKTILLLQSETYKTSNEINFSRCYLIK